jgi:hypothetical protein
VVVQMEGNRCKPASKVLMMLHTLASLVTSPAKRGGGKEKNTSKAEGTWYLLVPRVEHA